MEELYNGIRLPDVWPPRDMDDMSLSELPVPYLENRPDVALIDVGRQLFVDDFLIEENWLEKRFHQAVLDEIYSPIGLNIGADDYVTKPFTPLELMARVNSQLRRYTQFANRSPKEEKNDRIHVIGGLELNEDTVEVFVDGKPVKMTPIEFKILALLIRTPGRVYSADEIYERVWNEKAINTDTIMVHVRNIRDKIEINPKDPKYLKVVWGVGYKIEKQQ